MGDKFLPFCFRTATTFSSQSPPSTKANMAPVDEIEVVYQRFRYRINERLQSLPAQSINNSEVQYVLWSEVQEKLGRTSYLTNVVGNKQRRVLFEVDKDYRV